ncbi:MAG: HAMP domain-containing sensor histidine kinase [Gemmatimonas sp.]
MATTTESRAATPEELAEARATLAAERRRVAALALFARRMSHDMSNFVTVVRTYSELLLADLPADGAVHGDVQEIHRAADGMIDYMHRIVRFARSTSAVPGALSFDESIADAVKSSSFSHRVRVQLASDATVNIDATLLIDSVRELIANAGEAAPGGSLVQVRSWNEYLRESIVDGGLPIDAGRWAILEIADEGPGFSDDVRADALDPFVTTKNAVRGAGFGLSLARSAAWNGGGQMIVEPPNAAAPGTRVRLWLPISAG